VHLTSGSVIQHLVQAVRLPSAERQRIPLSPILQQSLQIIDIRCIGRARSVAERGERSDDKIEEVDVSHDGSELKLFAGGIGSRRQ
jgi:hypothetical protein